MPMGWVCCREAPGRTRGNGNLGFPSPNLMVAPIEIPKWKLIICSYLGVSHPAAEEEWDLVSWRGARRRVGQARRCGISADRRAPQEETTP